MPSYAAGSCIGVLDHAEGDGVDADAARRVLGGQRPGHRVQPALGQRRQGGGRVAVGMVDEARRDADDVAAALRDHVRDRALRDVEEPAQVHRSHCRVVGGRVVGERLADEDSRRC